MDTFDVVEAREARPVRKAPAMIINILTVLVLLMTVCFIGLVLVIFVNPYSAFNPFPPPILPTIAFYPTFTPTKTPPVLPPSWTPTVFVEPTSTPTPRPTFTPVPTSTPFGAPTETPDPTVIAGYSFVIQQGNPVAISSSAFHPDYGCAWMGVAGQALDMSGAPVPFLIVRLGGYFQGQTYDLTTVTGSATQYGGGSFFEFTLADKPIASRGALWLQLEDIAGIALSDKVYFDTYADCDRNLIILNFKQVK